MKTRHFTATASQLPTRPSARGLALAVILVIAAAIPAAAEAPQARQLYRAGVKLFNEGDFDGAAQVFARAELSAGDDARLRAKIALHLGLLHAIRGRQVRAREAFTRAFTDDPLLRIDRGRYDATVIELFDAVRAELSGTLRVATDLANAVITIDGQRLGVAPLARELPIGQHIVHARSADGGAEKSRKVVVGAGRTLEVSLRLAGPAAAADQGAAPRKRIWTWIAGGSALVLTGIGVGLWVAASDNQDERDGLLGLPARDEQQQARADDLKDTIHGQDVAANVMWGLAGAAAVTAVVLFFVEGRHGASPAPASVTLSPVIGQTQGLRLIGTF